MGRRQSVTTAQVLLGSMWSIFQVYGLQPITLQQRQGGDRVFIDSAGRERIFHGTNAVVKGPPWHPDPYTFSADISMAKEYCEWMQGLGLNVVRLGVLWSGVEPTRGHYNETYLDQLDTIVTLAAAHGVYTLLDWHQDGISEHFCGEGAPSWAIRRAEQPQLRYPFPFAPAFNDSSLFYREEKMDGSPTLPTRSACIASHGPGWGETTRETAQAYQAIYSNWQGVADAFATAQAKVASRFVRRPEILGIELMNEPFAGALIAADSC